MGETWLIPSSDAKTARKQDSQRKKLCPFFSQSCLALQHIHAKHILHRDLKTQNIFLTKGGTVKLGDFGIAKMLDHTAAEAMTVIGTPSYLAPEVCDSRPYGTKADIWSLGVVLYEMLTLELPFVARSLAALVVKIVTGKLRPVSPGMCTDETCRLVKHLLRKKPEKRFSVEEILALPVIMHSIELRRIVSAKHQLLSLPVVKRRIPSGLATDSEASTRACSRNPSIDSGCSHEVPDKDEQVDVQVEPQEQVDFSQVPTTTS